MSAYRTDAIILLSAFCLACSSGNTSGAGAGDGGGATDAGATDTAAADAAPTDTGTTDTGPADTGATDTGPVDVAADLASDATESGCGAITEFGTCEGKVVQWCSDGELQTWDCTEDVDEAEDVVCKEISADYGTDCAYADGYTCVDWDEDDEPFFYFCMGDDAGCATSPDGDLCASSVGTCNQGDVETCMGDHAVWACEEGQPATYDCKAFAGQCSLVDDIAVCTGVAVGGTCDGEMVLCADGASCVGASATDWGACE